MFSVYFVSTFAQSLISQDHISGCRVEKTPSRHKHPAFMVFIFSQSPSKQARAHTCSVSQHVASQQHMLFTSVHFVSLPIPLPSLHLTFWMQSRCAHPLAKWNIFIKPTLQPQLWALCHEQHIWLQSQPPSRGHKHFYKLFSWAQSFLLIRNNYWIEFLNHN